MDCAVAFILSRLGIWTIYKMAAIIFVPDWMYLSQIFNLLWTMERQIRENVGLKGQVTALQNDLQESRAFVTSLQAALEREYCSSNTTRCMSDYLLRVNVCMCVCVYVDSKQLLCICAWSQKLASYSLRLWHYSKHSIGLICLWSALLSGIWVYKCCESKLICTNIMAPLSQVTKNGLKAS